MSGIEELVQVSARLGQDLDLVQAGGGNTSWKENGTLWIKASGKWLVNAAREEMFLPVPVRDVIQDMNAGRDTTREYETPSGARLRPSVETSMHAVMPHAVVIHLHSVRTIAWAVQGDGQDCVADRLQGLCWRWIPYVHPGFPLARRIQEELGSKPDVLILENHGLVVGGESCAAAAALVSDVERRLSTEAPSGISREQLTGSEDWQLPEDTEVHALGADERFCEIASGGTMYPDHCVYLGPAAATCRRGERLEDAVERYRAKYDFQPRFVLVEGKGVLVAKGFDRAARELLICLKRVVERIPIGKQVRYLSDAAVARLMNWDAEKYRIALARMQE
jgi:rhamnose utilization protein RhaD (predicted bifunctional aldolase and dehydrogenase)